MTQYVEGVRWDQWSADRFSWDRKSAKLFLQGLSVQALLGPRLLLLDGVLEDTFVPAFGVQKPVLAEVKDPGSFFTPSDLHYFLLQHKVPV